MELRDYQEADAVVLAELFTASIHTLAIAHYDAEQRTAWAPVPPDLAAWRERLRSLQTLLALAGEACLGFISYEADGHIDLLYTAPDAARRGAATALLQECAARLYASGIRELYTEASLVALPFFRHQGFGIVEEQRVLRRGVQFRRYAMRKTLT